MQWQRYKAALTLTFYEKITHANKNPNFYKGTPLYMLFTPKGAY